MLVKLRQELDQSVPGVRCVVKQLEQGPPVKEPIQIRLSGENLDKLRQLADQTAAELRAAGGYHVFDDLGLRMPNIEIDIDQDRANSLGLNNQQIGGVAQASFTGLKVTELREGDRLIPILARGRIEDRSEAEKIRGLYVPTPDGKAVPFESFSTLKVQPEFVTIPHYNQLRTVTVKAYAPFGELPSQILDRARPGLAKIHLDPGYEMKFAGEDEELRKNRAEMGLVMQMSLALICMTMVLQFKSVIKSVVVMLTVPLGTDWRLAGTVGHLARRLGFMALLAMVSLAGVMVSHIIVLSDFIEHARAKGLPLEEALVQAGLARLRPVLVTVLATVGGLIPLFLTGGALWHPLTAVHIFGLLLATVHDPAHVADALLRLLRQAEIHQVTITLCVHFISNCRSGPSVALTLAGCAVGPNYKRPAVNAPAGFRDATNTVSTNSFADLPWWGVFKDPVLQDLVREALTNNYDLRITLTRVDQARALQMQARSQFLPQVGYEGEASRGRNTYLDLAHALMAVRP